MESLEDIVIVIIFEQLLFRDQEIFWNKLEEILIYFAKNGFSKHVKALNIHVISHKSKRYDLKMVTDYIKDQIQTKLIKRAIELKPILQFSFEEIPKGFFDDS